MPGERRRRFRVDHDRWDVGRGHVAVSADDPLEKLRLVDGIAQRIAERDVLEGLRGRTALRDGVAGPGAVAVEAELDPAVRLAGDRLDVRLGLQPVELLDRDGAGVIDVALDERLDHRVGVLEDLDEDLVLVPLLLQEVVRVPLEVDDLVGRVLDDLVLPGTDHRRLEQVARADGQVGLLAEDVLRQDRDVGLEDLRGPVVRVQDHGLVVGALRLA